MRIRALLEKLVTKVMAWTWCGIMSTLERCGRLGDSAAYPVAAVHCLFLGLGFTPVKRAYTDLLRLPILLLRKECDSG